MSSREPTAADFPDCDEFEITASQQIEPGTEARVVVSCTKDDLVETRAQLKKDGYRIWFMVGKKAKPA